MTSNEFIDRICLAVYESSVDGIDALLKNPPGRQPPEILVALSRWFDQLPQRGQQHLHETVQLAVRKAIFGMLTVLDDVRSIKVPGEEGILELHYKNNEKSVLLNDPVGVALHDLFVERVPLK